MTRSLRWRQFATAMPLKLFLVALLVRLIPVLLAVNLGIGLDDMFQYDMLARSLAVGNGFRWYSQQDLPLIQPYIHLDLSAVNYDSRGVLTSFRAPLYPVLLALIYLVSGLGTRRFFAARLVQAFLGAALAPLTYALARQLIPGREKAARISAWVIGLYPLLILYPLALVTENLFFLLVLGSAVTLLKAAENRDWKWFVASGILFGLTALTRSIALIYIGLAILWIWLILKERRMAVATLAAVVLVITPWVVRNSLLLHRLSSLENSMGYNLYVGYYPTGTGTFQYPQSLDLLSIVDDGVREQVGYAKAWGFIKADPARVPYLIVRRAGYFFGLERRALTYFYSNNIFGYIPTPALLAASLVLLVPFVIVAVSSAFGLASLRSRPEILLLVLILVGYITPHLLILAEDRFHLAILPFLVIPAAQAWTGGAAALKERSRTKIGKVALILAGLVVLLLCLNWGGELWRDAGRISQLLGPHGNQTYFPY